MARDWLAFNARYRPGAFAFCLTNNLTIYFLGIT